MSAWTPERIAVLRKLWDEGKGIVQIAREMGVTHGAIIAKVKRLEWAPREPRDNRPRIPSVKKCHTFNATLHRQAQGFKPVTIRKFSWQLEEGQ